MSIAFRMCLAWGCLTAASEWLSAAEPLSPSAKIDALLATAQSEHGIEPNPPATDEVFLRRIYLDVIGRIPTADEAERFLQSTAADKRALLIDELLDSQGYANHYATYWADVLRINQKAGTYTRFTMPYFLRYLRDALAENKPYDELVREMLTASGSTWDNPAVGFYLRDADMPLDNMSNTVRIFLGTRIECAQCHDHPFDVWTQRDYYHLGAFTYGMNAMSGGRHISRPFVEYLKEQGVPREEIGKLNDGYRPMWDRVLTMTVVQLDTLPELPHDYQYDDGKPGDVMEPQVPFGPRPRIDPDTPLAVQYAQWVTSPENERFAQVVANRLWKRSFGVAVIEPLDELTDDSEPFIPELMEYLQKQIVAENFDMKSFLRMIFNTEAYQRTATVAEWTPGTPYYFPGPLLRRMTAEQAWDSLVALINENPEASDWQEEVRLQLLLEERERVGRAVCSLTIEEKVDRARLLAELRSSSDAHAKQLRQRLDAALLAGDQPSASRLARQHAHERHQYRNAVRSVTISGTADGDIPPLPTAVELGLPKPREAISAFDNLEPDVRLEMERQAHERIRTRLIARGINDPKQLGASVRAISHIERHYIRAVYLPQPAAGDHFLRIFGQSDRETIENSSDEASLLQSLMLMNSDLLSKIGDPHAVLGQHLAEVSSSADSPAKKIDTLYVAILSRRPTASETEMLLSTVEVRGEKAYADILFALLNSHEFLYVQ